MIEKFPSNRQKYRKNIPKRYWRPTLRIQNWLCSSFIYAVRFDTRLLCPKDWTSSVSNCRASVSLRLDQAKTEQFLPDSKFHELSIATDIQFMVVTFQLARYFIFCFCEGHPWRSTLSLGHVSVLTFKRLIIPSSASIETESVWISLFANILE